MELNYYLSSFLWSTSSKVLTAIINFFSIPLLLGLWGKGDYGVLSLATACNGYMSLLDLGMNSGAVKYYSQWAVEGKKDLIYRVAQSNTFFYILISFINMIGLIAIALWGESLFNITHEQFIILRTCLLILAFFSIPTWISASYNQLLVADKQLVYTQKVQCVLSIFKIVLVVMTIVGNLTLVTYYFFFTLILAFLFIPYAYKCKKDRLIDNFRIKFYWADFKIVLMYSLALFALSIFQVTATQSRPILLGIFSSDAANIVAEFRIIEVIPLFIVTVGGTLSTILLPRSSELVAKNQRKVIKQFAYRGTTITTILANILCIPFILGAQEILVAYVGIEYQHLTIWLIMWCVTVLIQIHTTPGNSLVLAYGKTRLLVCTSAIACVISMFINVFLCKYYGVGSAVIGYLVYVSIVIGAYYVVYYHKLICLNRYRMFLSFIKPTFCSLIALLFAYLLPFHLFYSTSLDNKVSYILFFILKGSGWLIMYLLLLIIFKIVRLDNYKIKV